MTGAGKSFGAAPLFSNISIHVPEGARLGLIGPNGSGKSTLLKIMAGLLEPDTGTRTVRKLTRVAYVPQEPEFAAGMSTGKVLEEALERGLREGLDEAERAAAVGVTLGKAGFADGSGAVESLSGGWKRRLSIARELIRNPDVLLLDEPTNHLDLEGILWLEKLLEAAPFAAVVVSHDRYFLENAATEVAEINQGAVRMQHVCSAEGRMQIFWRSARPFWSRNRSSRPRWRTGCGARWSGCGAARRRARVSRERVSMRRMR